MIITTPPEPQSPSHRLQSTPGGTQGLTTDASGSTAKSTAPVYNETMLHQLFSSSDDVLDEDGIEKAFLPMGLPLGQVFSLPQDKAMRSKTPYEVLEMVSGGSQDSLSASQPHRVVAGPSARSAWAWGTGGAARLGTLDANRLGSGKRPHTLGTEVNQIMALVPAESLPVETDNTGTQHQTKGKRKETPEHTSRKKRRMSWRGDILETQDLETQEHIPVGDPSQVRVYPHDFRGMTDTLIGIRCSDISSRGHGRGLRPERRLPPAKHLFLTASDRRNHSRSQRMVPTRLSYKGAPTRLRRYLANTTAPS
jgi:hypothetical protein